MRISTVIMASLLSCGLSSQAGLYLGDTSSCEGASYVHDEASNALGPGSCASKCDCDGNRTCNLEARCEGVARNGDSQDISHSHHNEHVLPPNQSE